MLSSRPFWSLWSIQVAAFVSCVLISSLAAHAEVTLDGTLGPSGPLTGPDYLIHDNLGQLRGPNLFHSFGDFTINTGESATFTGPNHVENILGRVTGGSASWIDGRLSSQIPGANLFLMNPSGLMFGPNATLDVNGSFHATTADYIGLADGGRFDATTPGTSVLTAAPPEAFGFLGGNPAGISIDKSTLSVPSTETISLIGGDIEISGDPGLNPFEVDNVAAPSGRVNIASVASAGKIVPNISVATPEISVDGSETLGKIHISEGALVNTSGKSGGTVVIRGGQLVLDGAAIFSDTQGDIDGADVGVDIKVSGNLSVINGGVISTEAIGAGDAGDIQIRAGDVEIKRAPDKEITLIWSRASGSGDAGNITVKADQLTIDSAEISTPTFGSGDSGDIVINVTDVRVSSKEQSTAGSAGIFANSFNNGASGNVEVRAQSLNMSNRASIQSAGFGSGGAGGITIETDSLELRDGSFISSTGFFGEGLAHAGDIKVIANRILISGFESAENPFGLDATSIFSGARDGDGGDVTIVAKDSVTLSQRATITTSSFGEGRSGQLQLTTQRLEILDGSHISGSAFGTGNGGDIAIDADTIRISGVNEELITDTLGRPSMSPSGLVSQSGINGGAAGTIQVTARRLEVLDGGVVSSATFGPGNGGAIDLETDQVVVAGENAALRDFLIGEGFDDPVGARSTISTSTQSDVLGAGTTGNAGVITIYTGELLLQDRGLIGSNTTGPGLGGSIEITAGHVRLSSDSTIESRSRSLVPEPGDAGNIHITVLEDFESTNSTVLAQADNADGGDIEINANKLVYLREDSAISASVGGGDGIGGNITIDPQFVVLNRSNITANASGGPGGNILIVTDHFIKSSDSAVTASSEFGVDGEVVIRSPEETVIVGVEALPESFLDISSLLSDRCAARTEAKVGSVVVLGKGGVPPGPDVLLPSSYVDIATQGDARSTRSTAARHKTGHNMIVVRNGERMVSGARSVYSFIPTRLALNCRD